ncbi:MAG: ComF family protein [Bacteroidales bacterium]|jgi:ComF family protein
MNYLYNLWDDVISLLFPRICYGCGNQLLRNELYICTECYVAIPRSGYHLKPDNPVAQIFWGRCLIEKAAAFSYYTRGSRIRNLIHSLKYRGVKEIGFELGKIYALSLKGSGFFDNIDLIVPVPLHPSKLRKRGYNQSDFISAGISAVTGILVDTGALVRTAGTKTQTRKSRYDRWVNVEGIFRIEGYDRILNKHVLLVDDVITTGSTVESCANAILATEGTRVSVLALAFSTTG